MVKIIGGINGLKHLEQGLRPHIILSFQNIKPLTYFEPGGVWDDRMPDYAEFKQIHRIPVDSS